MKDNNHIDKASPTTLEADLSLKNEARPPPNVSDEHSVLDATGAIRMRDNRGDLLMLLRVHQQFRSRVGGDPESGHAAVSVAVDINSVNRK